LAKVRVDFSKARDFEAMPVGPYPVVVEETEIRDGKEFPYINWTFKVETGENAGRKLWMRTSLDPNSTWSLKAALKALGETSPQLNEDTFEIDPDDYLGRRAIANVSQETYQGTLRNNIDTLSPIQGTPTSSSGVRTGRVPAGIR
jgi:hypothetical protein